MKLRWKEKLQSVVVVVSLTAVLIVLAFMQYRWSNQVSQATSERMEVDLESTMMRWRDDLYREIAGFCFQLQVDPESTSHDRLKQYSQQYSLWAQTAAHPSVVSGMYILESDGGGPPMLLKLDMATGEFRKTEWPERFRRMHDRIESISTDFAIAVTHLKSPEEMRESQSRKNGRVHIMAKQFPVLVDQDVPALMQPIYHQGPRNSSHADVSAIDWVVLELDNRVLTQHIIPELVSHQFGKSQSALYEVAVVTGSDHRQVVYSSDAQFPGKGAEPDEEIRIFGPPYGPTMRGSDMILLPAWHRQSDDGKFHELTDLASTWPVRIEPLHYSADDGDWYIIARHRKGSLEAAVASLRRRDLAVSFTVLLLLGASILILVINSRRSQALARMQMEFVAAVSHELRTPLAVICSAADNMADGVVDGKKQMQQYGGVIKNSARQLIHLVEQVLMFAATRNQRYRFNFAPLNAEEIVDGALANTAEIIAAADFRVERSIAPGLPEIMGDRGALITCLQNLITNAVKYGGEKRWMSVHAEAARAQDGRPEVRITVEDHGIGMSPGELRHIFSSFYRSPSVAAAQIRGTGLGLSLAKSIAEGMGGRITVVSSQGKGSAFTLHLPGADTKTAEAEATVGADANPKFAR